MLQSILRSARFLVIIAACAAAIAFTTPALGQTIVYVNAASDNDDPPSTTNPGDTWEGAFKHLQSGLAWARLLIEQFGAPSAQVWVATGTYRPDLGHNYLGIPYTPGNQHHSLTLRPGISVYGGFEGDEPGTQQGFEQRDPETFIVTLSGDLSSNDGANFTNRADNSYHVVKGEGVALDVDDVFDGFTIRSGFGGVDVGEDPEREGGGMYLKNAGTPRIVNCLFTDNTARKGGGMYIEQCAPTIRSCDFEANLGGPSVPNVLFQGAGGGLYVFRCSPTVVDCRFIDNVAGQTIPSGLAGGTGGGIQVIDDAAPRIFNCEFIRNRCGHVGGGINIRESDADVETLVVNCIFIANFARDSGGGCRVGLEGRSRFVQCTFVENYCSDNGDITHQGSGGGLSLGRGVDEAEAREVRIDNCIFWNNRIHDPQAHGSQIALMGFCGGTVMIKYTNIQDSDGAEDDVFVQADPPCVIPPDPTGGFILEWGAGRLDVDPDFVEDPSPGTGGIWGNGDDDFGDLRLNNDSPVIGKGLCSLIPLDLADVNNNGNTAEELPWDLGTLSRKVSRVDLGAMENQNPTCNGDANNDWTVGVADLLAVINQWSLTGAPSGDVSHYPCGDSVVGVADLLTVIARWGPCPPPGEEGTLAGAPQSVQDCITSCSPLGIGSPSFEECLTKCIESLP